jgi:hypothetical protein
MFMVKTLRKKVHAESKPVADFVMNIDPVGAGLPECR